LAVSVGSLVIVVGTFLPWLQSGAVARSSYEIFDLVDRLGFSPDGAVGWSLRLWPVVPLLLVLGVVLQWAHSERALVRAVRLLLPVVVALYVGATAVAVRLAPASGLFRYRFGTWVTLLGSLAVVGASAWSIRSRGSGSSGAS
jgi:hypothetical protein